MALPPNAGGASTPLPRLVLRSSAPIPMPAGVPVAHASSMVALADGELVALWWAGTRESAPDVAIYASRWNGVQWSAARRIVERHDLARQLGFGVRRIGNPVAWAAPDGRVHMYAVATGPGGWAASRVVHLVSNDRASTFTAQRVLPLTPLFNTSVLVRSHPVALEDGGWVLPAYFEMGNKYPMLIAMDSQGVPQWSARIGASATSLQPALLPVSPTEVRAVMRDHGAQRRIQQARSGDGGRNWSDEAALENVNQDSAVGALHLAGGGYVMVHNDRAAPDTTPRQWLRLSTSHDAITWQPALDVELGVPGDEYSYPSLQQIGNVLHVTYTWQRKAIMHRAYEIVATGTAP